MTPSDIDSVDPASLSAMLTDSFGRRHSYLRLSLTEKCNLRCRYCMPAAGVPLAPGGLLLSATEAIALVRLFAAGGVTKVRLTGGEPTLRADLEDIVGGIAALPGIRTVAMTTNGLTLAKRLPGLQAAGLSQLNISLDTLRPDRFESLTLRPGHGRVLAAIAAAESLGFSPLKLNVVVMRGVNEDEVGDFVALTRDRGLNVRFIEYMPFDGNGWAGAKMAPYADVRAAVEAAAGSPLLRMDDHASEVAKNFRVAGHRGTVSFVTSMTEHFCGGCNRLRLLADGALKVCLHGPAEVSLRDVLRSGGTASDLAAVIAAAVRRKRAAHAGMDALAVGRNRAMITIGG